MAQQATTMKLTEAEKAMAAEITAKLEAQYKAKVAEKVKERIERSRAQGETEKAVEGLKAEIVKQQGIRKAAYAEVKRLRKEIRAIKDARKAGAPA